MARTLAPADLLASMPTVPRRPVGRGLRGLRGLVAMALVAGVWAIAGPAPAAQAALGDLDCETSFQINFTPALTLTNTTADAQADAAVVDCVSPNGNYPNLDSGTVEGSGEAESLGGVPCSLLLTIEGDGRIEWNTGQVSRFDFILNTNPLNGTLAFMATITSGPLNGDTVIPVPAEANPNPDCALVGLTQLTSVATIASFN